MSNLDVVMKIDFMRPLRFPKGKKFNERKLIMTAIVPLFNIFRKNTFKFVALISLFHHSFSRQLTMATVYKPFPLNYLYKLVESNPATRNNLSRLFNVTKKFNLQPGKKKKVIAYSLFWKARFKHHHQPIVNEKTIYNRTSTVKKNDSFNHLYVEPLIKQLEAIKHIFPRWIARIYLAHDLKFLIPRLSMPHVEIFLMESSSIAAVPGSLWRFLVFDDPAVDMAYIRDADCSENRYDGNFVHSPRVRKWLESVKTKGFFRLKNLAAQWLEYRNLPYSPISAGAFGGKLVHWINMKKAMIGFIMHRTFYPNERRHRIDGALEGFPYGYGNEFPNYGFDERFLKHVLYFEAAKRKELTLIPTGYLKKRIREVPRNHVLKLDLMYTKFKSVGGF